MSTHPAPDSSSWEDIKAWRTRTRDTLLEWRVALASHVRSARGSQAIHRLKQSVDLRRYRTIGVYWPIRGEINARDLARELIEQGGQVGLPVVVTRAAPVEFWAWQPGCGMTRGLWDIPIPRDRQLVLPEALIIPLVGFDAAGYRLGYGGGYYDRTIAAAQPQRPFCIGLGYADTALATIYPQPHDMRMDLIVTERQVIRAS